MDRREYFNNRDFEKLVKLFQGYLDFERSFERIVFLRIRSILRE